MTAEPEYEYARIEVDKCGHIHIRLLLDNVSDVIFEGYCRPRVVAAEMQNSVPTWVADLPPYVTERWPFLKDRRP